MFGDRRSDKLMSAFNVIPFRISEGFYLLVGWGVGSEQGNSKIYRGMQTVL